MTEIILASSSPRRRELAKLLPYNFTFRSPDCPENFNPGLSAEENILNIARKKAESVRVSPSETVIGCDTVVVLDGDILGKPENEARARDTLRRLSGREHTVMTGVCILHPGAPARIFAEATRVYFDNLCESEIEAYLRTGEPYDKAGAYGIQGGGALFVRKIDGDYFNVVGLPVGKIYRELRKL